jgi:glycosyltransferase involved in cell wall biosynthesis
VRLLLSAYACRPNAGSEPGCGWNWATHLAARGIEVHVLVAKRNEELIEASLRFNPIPNLHFTYVPVAYEWAKKSESLHYVCWQVAALQAARKLASDYQFQLAHHVTYASIHVPTQLWRLDMPVVFGPVGGGQTAPGSMLPYFGAEKSKERLRSSITKALMCSPLHRDWLRRMSFVLAANRDTLNIVQTLGCMNTSLMCDTAIAKDYLAEESRAFEIPDVSERNSGGRSGRLSLLWVGRMLKRKALPLALDALKEVHNDGVTLTIAGDGEDPRTVHQMIEERNLERRVIWKGSRMTASELRQAYSEHDGLLFTSLRDSFGSQLLEAMSMALPVITLDLHGAHDWLPDVASIKVPVGCPGETVRNLATAIEEYASLSPTSRSQMSTQARTWAKTQTWSARAEFCERLYENVLSGAYTLENASASRTAVAKL